MNIRHIEIREKNYFYIYPKLDLLFLHQILSTLFDIAYWHLPQPNIYSNH